MKKPKIHYLINTNDDNTIDSETVFLTHTSEREANKTAREIAISESSNTGKASVIVYKLVPIAVVSAQSSTQVTSTTIKI